MLVASARDTRLMTLYSNARLIVYDDQFKLHPDILESYEVKDNREFTFKLRAGHKWSDGQPFTTEDFRFFWEDIANNKELSPSGPSVELMVDGQPPKVEIIDALTIKFTWDKPNPYFIESQARAAPLFLFRPAHYLKKFHAQVHAPEEIAKAAKGGQSGNWVQIHRRLDVMYANDNPDLPTLNAWSTSRPRRRSASCSSAIPTTTASTTRAAAALSRPRDLHRGGDQPGARPRRGWARPTCSRAISTCATTLSCRRAPRARASTCGCGNRARARSSRSIPTSTPRTRCGAS